MNLAIVQARTDSTRLPNKVLKNIGKFTLIEWVIRRVEQAKTVDKIVVATTTNAEDDKLVDFLGTIDVDCFRGSEDDVLQRFYQCAQQHSPEVVTRITADDPLKEPLLIDKAFYELMVDGAQDYCSNTQTPSYPEGLDVEVFRYAALEKACIEAKSLVDREHVTSYIWNNKHLFNCIQFYYEEDLSNWRWTIDKREDLDFFRVLVKEFGMDFDSNYENVIDFLKNREDILAINTNKTIRNEGYLNSIEKHKLGK